MRLISSLNLPNSSLFMSSLGPLLFFLLDGDGVRDDIVMFVELLFTLITLLVRLLTPSFATSANIALAALTSR